jgi:DNA-binding NtrC family response regulator
MSRTSKIMIVDDEPNVRLVFRTTLEAEGYEVVEAIDGLNALSQLESTRVNLVLLDLNMPSLDGMQTLRRLRERGDSTPVVIVTAHGSIPDAVAAMKLGAIDFLSKPMTPQALRTVVSEVVARHAEVPAPTEPARPEPAAAESRFAEKLTSAKRALNRREFDEAEFFLGQAITIEPRSREADRLMNLLRETRRDHEGPFRVLRDLFPVGRPRPKPS